MKNSYVLTVIEKLPEREIDGKKFNEIFQIDGIPVWYFFESLIKLQYLPEPFRSLVEIESEMRKGRAPAQGSLKSKLAQFGLRKGLRLNEGIKWFIASSRKPRGGEKDVLFLGYTNQAVRIRGELRPAGFHGVIDALKGRGVRPIVLFCDPLTKKRFKIPLDSRRLLEFPDLLYSYVDAETIKESKLLAHELNQKWGEIDEKKKAELFAFDGRSYWQFLKDELNFLFSREMMTVMITYYLTFKKIIEKHEIKVIFLTALGGFYETLLLGVAHKLNKKVVLSSHGYGSWFFIVREKFLKNVYFAAWGDEERKKLMKQGIKKEKIFVTGPLFFDEIPRYKKKKEAKRARKTVTLLTALIVEAKHMGGKEYFDYVRKFLDQINKVKNVAKIVIKLHPLEKYKSQYESVAKSLGLRNVEITETAGKGPLYSLLSDSDLLVSFGSTADIEGLMLDKNVIVIDGLIRGAPAEIQKKDKYRKAVLNLDKNSHLARAITKVLYNKDLQKKLKRERENYLRDSFYRIDGKAHERVADLIARLKGRRGAL